MPVMETEGMKSREKEDFAELYGVVKRMMGYGGDQCLTREMCLRLKGLAKGRYMENKRVPASADYPLKAVTNTFKYCSADISRGLARNAFRDDRHKFEYMMKIVESHLNEVYMRMEEKRKADEELSKPGDGFGMDRPQAPYARVTGDSPEWAEGYW